MQTFSSEPKAISPRIDLESDCNDRNQIDLVLLGIIALAAALCGISAISDEYLRGWDAPTHIFFSSSYLNGWWDTWEPRWYGGYTKVSYPPLAHQLVAAITILTGDLERSYKLVTWAFLSIGPFAVYRFSKNFVDDRSGVAAALLFVFLPSIRSLVFVFGQYAGFVSLVFLLLAMGALGDYLRTGRKLAGVSAICLVACVAASHHGTTIFLLPPTLIVTTIANLGKENRLKCFIARSLTIWVLCVAAALIVVLPFWIWFLDLPQQVPIPHPSRDNIFQTLFIARVFFFDIYGPFMLMVPLAVAQSTQQRSQIILVTTYMLFMILGLGGTTSLPSLLYGERWQWLTFERFGVWATVLLLPLAGRLIVQVRNQFLFYTATATSALLVFSTLGWLVDPGRQRITPPPIELGPVFESFVGYPLCAERYLALGFDYQFPELSTYTGAKTLDGLWHTARTDPLLTNSGVGQLSDVLHWNNGEEVLDAFLSREDPFPACCIFINEVSSGSQQYRDIVAKHGWKTKKTFSNKVSLWMNDSVSSKIPNTTRTSSRTDRMARYLWGILPLLSFCLAFSVDVIRWSKNTKQSHEISSNYNVPAQ